LADLGHYLAFVGVSLLVICTPGQDTALTIRNTLLGGRRAGAATAAGVSAGQAVWTVATSAGLAVLLMASGPLFLLIRLLGAGYLVYLGGRSLLRAAARADSGVHGPDRLRSRLAPAAAFWQGLLSNLSNAKMVAFFISLLPQFAGPHPTFFLLLTLGLAFSLLTLGWLTIYAFAVERMGGFLRRVSVRRMMEATLGAVLVGLGLRLGAEALSA
jgi:threonine/homoserine/homoserine lactone efflux protein